MTTKLISQKDWLKHTDSIGHPRSYALKALDAALLAHEAHNTGATLARVKEKFTDWKSSQGPGTEWKKSRRNKDGYLDLLETLVTKGADSDAAWKTVPDKYDFMNESIVHARLGVVYLFAHCNVDPKIFNVILEGGLAMTGSIVTFAGISTGEGGLGNANAALASAFTPMAMVGGNEVINASKETVVNKFGAKPSPAAQAQSLIKRVIEFFTEIGKRILAELRKKWNCELPAQLVKTAINAACGLALTAAASGSVAGALDTLKGSIQTIDAVITKVRSWRLSTDVEIASGHPGQVVTTIRRAMTASVFEGLWTLLKGVTAIGVSAAAAGAGMITGVLIAGVEMIIKVFWRIYEAVSMTRFFGEAADHWRNRDSASALHKQPFAFARWYRKHTLLAPPLAILTLNSGICGDKMTYLSMFNDDESIIDPAKFIAGAEYLDSLKVWGKKYLDTCGFAFSSNDLMVGRYLKFAEGGGTVGKDASGNKIKVAAAHQENLSGGWKAWDYAVRAATA